MVDIYFAKIQKKWKIMYIFAIKFEKTNMDFTHVLTEPYTMALTALLAVSFVVLVLYYGLYYFRVGHCRAPKSKKKEGEEEKLPPVSVVMVAQNDAGWLKNNLMYLLEQDYPKFEVVVVDYLSNDDTQYVLQLLSANYPYLKVVTFQANASGYQGMKYPLSIGIKSASYDVLLFAEPECIPMDTTNFGWIKEMVKGYVSPKVEIVLGYCGIQYRGSLLNWLQQYDNLDYSVEYLGAALLHRPFTGNGRNLSYKRSLFLKKDGFIYHYYIPDGADDMFVNQNSNRRNTKVVLSESSFTQVAEQKGVGEWHSYRKHRSSTHRYYGFGLKMRRLMRPLNVLLFYLSAALLLVAGTFPWQILAAVVAVKLIWQVVATAQATHRLGIKPVIFALSPLFEIYFLISNTFLAIFPLSKKS